MGQYAQPGYYPPSYYHQGQVAPFPPSVETTNAAPVTVAQVSVGKDATKTTTKTSSAKKSKDTLAKEAEATAT